MVPLLLLAGVFAALSTGMKLPSNECCESKDVGGMGYTLVGRMNTEGYNCLNDCIYVQDEEPGVKFCFASGDLEVECTEDETYEGTKRPPMEGSEMPPMEGSERPPMEGSEMPPMEGSEITPMEGSEMPPMEGSEMPPMEGSEMPPMEGSEMPPMKGSEIPPMEGSEMPPMEGSEMPPMEGSEIPPMEGSEMPPMEGSERPPMEGTVQPGGTGIIWTATGEVPDKLAQAPPQPLYLAYSGQEVRPNDTVTTDDMLDTPTLKWETEEGALYSIVLIDFGIERLGGLQFYHWLVANVQDSLSIASGDEVKEYIAPFYFATNEDGTALDTTVDGKPGHDILVLVYKQKNGSVEMIDERQSGCEGITSNRIGDHAALAEKYDLELIAGNFFFTTYTEATNYFLCLFTKCTGEQFPLPAPGINDGPECQQEPTTTTS